MNLSNSDRSTLVLALSSWIARCKTEAATMQEWAVSDSSFDTATREKCLANAAASLAFQADAEALLARL